ncbi:hypothetical protein DFH07DRAFT_439037 [Mycena maculata]|uniref:Uncharacterized protein n=1 Tax=Mycena maculata TaxID=230809 RepID=A0AAD7NYT8_9AGAR|nr:hypothetical protein DFH07DRAFT_439037 [Mycena maculata]
MYGLSHTGMAPTSRFTSFFPLVIDSTTYGIYSVLFFQSVQVLCSRKRPNYEYHLGCMIVLFLLSTIHIALAYAWAFITDAADAAIYEVFSLKNPLPPLYGADDPFSVHRIAILIKIRYTLANALADGILIHRCYVIWGHNWRAVAFPIFTYVFTLIGGILGLLPLSGPPERAALGICVGTVFFTNVVAAALAAGRIWWITQRAAFFLGKRSRKKYLDLTAILIESGLIYPAALVVTIGCFLSPATPTVSVLICIAACYHIVGIAPTLIIVRVGLGLSTDDVDQCVSTITNGMEPSTPRTPHAVRRADTTVLELQFRDSGAVTTGEDSLDHTKLP